MKKDINHVVCEQDEKEEEKKQMIGAQYNKGICL